MVLRKGITILLYSLEITHLIYTHTKNKEK